MTTFHFIEPTDSRMPVRLAIFCQPEGSVALLIVHVRSDVSVNVDATNKMNIAANIGAAGSTRAYSIGPSFLGFSIEISSILYYFDPVTFQPRQWFVQLLNNLKNLTGKAPRIRLGGNSSDRSWYDPNGVPNPPRITYDITPQLFQALNRLSDSTGVQFVFGLNFARGDSAVYAIDEVRAIKSLLGYGKILAFQIGNEPDLYTTCSYRPCGYTYTQFKSETNMYIDSIRSTEPTVPGFEGGSFCCPWLPSNSIDLISTQASRYKSFSFHLYPLSACGPRPTISELLSDSSVSILRNSAIFQSIAREADRANTNWFLGETNNIVCEGFPGTSDSFAGALWSLDWMFSAASLGASGLNFHGSGFSSYSPIIIDPTGVNPNPRVMPQYYAMMMFSYATRSGASLLNPVLISTNSLIKIWGVERTDGTLVIMVNHKDISASAGTPVHITLSQPTLYSTVGQLVVLTAPSMAETTAVTFGGQTFAGTTTGTPSGSFTSTSIQSSAGSFHFDIQPHSAALLTISRSGTPSPPSMPPPPPPPPVTGSSIRLNCGGPLFTDPRGNVWQADDSPSSDPNKGVVATSSAPMSNTDMIPLYQSERWKPLPGDQIFSFVVANGIYQVTIHLAEFYSGAMTIGGRVFNVAINGVTAFANVDIFKDAGGGNRALVKSIQVSVVTGAIEIRCSHIIENPKISAIEIIVAGSVPPSPPPSTPPPPPVAGSVVRINVGGPSYIDSEGNPWASDQALDTAKGSVRSIVDSVVITGTPDPTIYRTYRFNIGSIMYSIPLINGFYSVRLHFSETFTGTMSVGARVFDISLNGNVSFVDTDIFKEAPGGNRALIKASQIQISTGLISIVVSAKIENPRLSGIEVLRTN